MEVEAERLWEDREGGVTGFLALPVTSFRVRLLELNLSSMAWMFPPKVSVWASPSPYEDWRGEVLGV